jgi:DNA sulfur modification protein DndB
MRTTNYPCVKATMGDWVYYATVMTFADIVNYVKFAEQVCPNEDLDWMIQREVSSRSKQIAQYLSTNEQRFFGTLIVAVYNGTPKFLPISFQDAPLLEDISSSIGVLRFDGSEQYYAIDGQHRLAAMQQAFAENPSRYESDQVSVIVVCHSRDKEGIQRARRLFTTLNRYAKKTSMITNIVMDEDDGIAIITRRLIRENQYFANRIKVLNKPRSGRQTLAKGEAMSAADRAYLMAIGSFYKCNKQLLSSDLNDSFSKAQQIPDFELLERGYNEVHNRWQNLIDIVSVWSQLKDTSVSLDHYRNKGGGFVLARPIGITSFISAAAKAIESGVANDRIANVAQRFADIGSFPWAGLLWNGAAQTMFAGKEREEIAQDLWEYYFGIRGDYDVLNEKWKSIVDPHHERSILDLPRRS